MMRKIKKNLKSNWRGKDNYNYNYLWGNTDNTSHQNNAIHFSPFLDYFSKSAERKKNLESKENIFLK